MERPGILYVSNLSFDTSEASLRSGFDKFEVEVHVIVEQATQKTRGFAIVTVPPRTSEAVIAATNGVKVDGRAIRVEDASTAQMLRMWLARNPEDFPPSIREWLQAP